MGKSTINGPMIAEKAPHLGTLGIRWIHPPPEVGRQLRSTLSNANDLDTCEKVGAMFQGPRVTLDPIGKTWKNYIHF